MNSPGSYYQASIASALADFLNKNRRPQDNNYVDPYAIENAFRFLASKSKKTRIMSGTGKPFVVVYGTREFNPSFDYSDLETLR